MTAASKEAMTGPDRTSAGAWGAGATDVRRPRHMRPALTGRDLPREDASDQGGRGASEARVVSTVRRGTPVTLPRPAAVPVEPPAPADEPAEVAVLRRPARPSRPYDDAYVTARCPRSRIGSPSVVASALSAVAVVLRVAAAALCVLVLANAMARGLLWSSVVMATAYVARSLPSAVSGRLVVPTVLGGTFRGDIAATAVTLFVADWACMRLAQGTRVR